MKNTILTSLFALASFMLRAQTQNEASRALYLERYQQAESLFYHSIRQNPQNADAWYGLTKSYLLQNKLKNAEDSLQSIPATVKENPYGKVAAGWRSLWLGNTVDASSNFEQALKQTKEKNPGVLAAIAEAHILAKSGDGNYAALLIGKAIKKDRKNAALYTLLGDAFRKMGNGSEAYKAYNQALSADRNYAPAHFKIGEIFLTQKNTELYLQHFNNAVQADPSYAPALYRLYLHEFYHDPAMAMNYYNRYLANADLSLKNEYDLTDLLYLNKQYDKAIEKANYIFGAENGKAEPRLYKLIGYSYAAKKDSLKALNYMEQYFSNAPDSVIIGKDLETLSALQLQAGNDSLAYLSLAKATDIEKDSAILLTYYKQLAEQAKKNDNYKERAKWLELYYTNNQKANNLDLYFWALSHYLAGEYAQADSVFGVYIQKYPLQSFGYYWQAKSKALEDKDMLSGRAVPAYQKLIDVLDTMKEDPNYKKWMVEAYGYLAAFEANNQKDYVEAVDYFEKVLELDADNEDAKRYITILEKRMEK